MAIRKVNAITGPGCAEAQDGQLSASGIRASAAPEGEHKGVRQRNTFGAERRIFAEGPILRASHAAPRCETAFKT